MAKKSLKRRNDKRINLSENFLQKRSYLKNIIDNQSIPMKERMDAFFRLSKMKKDSSKVRIRLRCNLTGRPRGNFRKFGVSRIALRELALIGQIPGLIKSSW